MRLNWYKVGFWVAAFGAWVIIFFTATGVYQYKWGIPERQAEIIEITRDRDAWKAQALDEQEYIEIQRAHIAKLETAMNFEKLFILLQNPQAIQMVGELQDRLENKAEFCLSGGEK